MQNINLWIVDFPQLAMRHLMINRVLIIVKYRCYEIETGISLWIDPQMQTLCVVHCLNLNVCSNLFSSHLSLYFFFSEEKSEQLLDTRQELENMEVELKRLQQEVTSFVTSTPTYILAFMCSHLPFIYCSLLFPSALFLQCCQALITQLVS